MDKKNTNVISESAVIGSECRWGDFCCVGDNVTLGDRCEIGNRVVIHEGTMIGSDVRIDDGAVIGKRPMRAANSAVTKDAQLPPAKIGANCILGAGIVVYCGCEIGKHVLVADLATLRENVSVGDYTIVGRGVAVENFCKIGRYVKLETNVYVTAYSELEDRVFMAPGVVTSNDNFIGRTEERFKHFKGVIVKRGARVGVSATILPGVTVNEDALVAAGALVTKDVPARKIVAGVPAKVFRDVPEEQLLENQGWKD